MCIRGGEPGGYTGRVIRDPAASPPIAGERSVTAKRAPEAPSGGWSGWSQSSGVTVGGDGS